MSGLLEAVKARLETLPINSAGDALPVALHDGTGYPYPRAVVWGGPLAGAADPSTAGSQGHSSSRMGVTLAGETGELVSRLAEAAIEAITPGFDPSVIVTARTRHDLIFDEHRGVDVDWQVTNPATGHHPAYVVALFTVHSQPI